MNRETTLIELDFLESQEEKKRLGKEGSQYEVVMKLSIKTNENAINMLKLINKSVQKFVSGWMKENISKEILVKSLKFTEEILEENHHLLKIDLKSEPPKILSLKNVTLIFFNLFLQNTFFNLFVYFS